MRHSTTPTIRDNETRRLYPRFAICLKTISQVLVDSVFYSPRKRTSKLRRTCVLRGLLVNKLFRYSESPQTAGNSFLILYSEKADNNTLQLSAKFQDDQIKFGVFWLICSPTAPILRVISCNMPAQLSKFFLVHRTLPTTLSLLFKFLELFATALSILVPIDKISRQRPSMY